LEFANLAALPATGETGKIYVALDTNKIYRWSGSAYIEVSPTVGTIWGGITGTLSNQTDLQNVLNLKAPLASPTFTGTVILPTGTVASADLNWTYYTDEVDLPSATTKHGMFAHVHNTGAAYYAHAGSWYKLAKQTDLDLKAPLASPTFTGTVSGITKSMVGLGSVDNTTDANKPVSTATQTALNLKYDATNPNNYIALTALSFVAGSGAYNNTTGVITIPTNNTHLTNGSNYITLASLSFVAGSGGYNSTTGVITIPTNNSQLTNGSNYITLTGLSSSATGLTYTNTTGVFSLTAGYEIPTTASIATWDTAYTNRITSLTVTGSSGAATLVSNVLNIPTYTLTGLGGVPTARTITINGTAQDLSANRSFTISTNPSARAEENFVATAAQTTFTITGGYVVGLVDVYVNGVRYLPTDYTATNGTTVVLGIGLLAGDAVTILNYTSSIAALPTSRNVQDFTATAAQTTYTVTNGYIVGLIDVFVNGSKLTSSEFTATNGTTFVLTVASTVGDQVQSINYTASVNGISGAGTINELAYFTASGTIASLPVATYPSLTELSYVKGVTSAIQTQLNAKAATLSGTTNYVAKFTSSSAIGNSLIQDNATDVGINGSPTSIGGYTSLTINNTSNGSFIDLNNSGVNNLRFLCLSSVDQRIQAAGALTFYTAGVVRLTLSSTGAATFSSRININGATDDADIALNVSAPSGSGKFVMFGRNSSNVSVYSLSSAGAATFSSSVTATGGIYVPIGTAVDIGTSGTSLLRLVSTGGINYIQSAINSTTGGSAAPLVFTSMFATNEWMRITSAGNVGIGTSSPSGKLDIRDVGNGTFPSAGQPGTGLNIRRGDGILGMAMGYEDNQGNSYIQVQRMDGTTSYHHLTLQYNGGNVLIGTNTNNGEKLYVSGAIRATGTITANSDLTLKKNLLKIENALEKVEKINGYTYEFKADDSKRHAGVIAQEIQTVLPEIVNKGNDGILGVEYGNISALLIEAIKEQQVQIEELKTLLKAK